MFAAVAPGAAIGLLEWIGPQERPPWFVAQLARAAVSKTAGCTFESCRISSTALNLRYSTCRPGGCVEASRSGRVWMVLA